MDTPTEAWYISAGQGMGAVLTMGNELLAYALSDRTTYLARKAQGLQLEILREGDPIPFNPDGVVALNPAPNSQFKGDPAQESIEWLISVPVQEKIGQFGEDRFGESLFMPDSVYQRAAH